MRNRKLVLSRSNKDYLWNLQDLNLSRTQYIYAYSRVHLLGRKKGTKILYTSCFKLSPEYDEILKEIEIRQLELVPLESEMEGD